MLKTTHRTWQCVLFSWYGVMAQQRPGVARALAAAGEQTGIEADWSQVEQAWGLRNTLTFAQARPARAERQRKASAAVASAPVASVSGGHAAMLDESLRATLADLGITDAQYPAAVRREVVATWQRLPLWPDVVPAMRQMSETLSLAVCSSADSAQLETAATAYGLPLAHVIGGDVLRVPPISADYFKAVARLTRKPAERTLFVDADGPQLRAAQQAGCATAMISREDDVSPLLPQGGLQPTLAAGGLLQLADMLTRGGQARTSAMPARFASSLR